MSEVTQSNAVSVPASPTLAEAFERTAAERAAVREMQHITVDVPSAITTVFGALSAIRSEKDLIDATFKAFPMRVIDNLEAYASAALYAHSAWLFASAPPADLQALIADATHRRARIVTVLAAASAHALIPANVLDELQGPKGHKNIAVDLIGATSVLRLYWPELEGKVPMTVGDLEKTQELGKKLLRALGARDLAPGPDDQLSIDRKRAFTLLAEAYGEVRAAVLYVRRNSDDADEVAPSLFAGRGGSKKKDDSGVEAKPSAAPVPAPAQAAPAAQEVPIGHPGSNPFTA